MTRRVLAFVLLGGITLAFIAALHPIHSARALQCFDAQNQPIPCEKEKKKKPTDVPPPTVDPALAVGPTSEPSGPVNTGGPGSCTGPNCANDAREAALSPWLIGGGGILIGLLLALGIGAMRGKGTPGGGDDQGFGKPGGDTDPLAMGPKHDDPAGSFFDDTGGGDTDPLAMGPKHDDPAGSFFDDSGGGVTDPGGLVSERDVPETPPGSPRPEPQPRLEGFDTEMNKGGDLVSERDVPEVPPGSPRPEPQPRLDGMGGEGSDVGGGTSDSSSLPKVKTKPGGGPATDGPGTGVGETAEGGQTWDTAEGGSSAGAGSSSSSTPHVKPGGGPASDGPGMGGG